MRNAKDKFVRDWLLSSACGGWEGVRRNFVSDPTIKYSLKSSFEPSGPSGRSLSRFPLHEGTKSISTPPWMGC